jgi:hypothetical protein
MPNFSLLLCSISNLGMYPVDQFVAIINPPQVLSFHPSPSNSTLNIHIHIRIKLCSFN